MSDIQSKSSTNPTPKPEYTEPVTTNTDSTNKKIETTEDTSVGTTKSSAQSGSSDPERDEKIIQAFKDAPIDGAPTTTPITQTSSTEATAATTSTESTTTAPPAAGESAPSDEENSSAFQSSSSALNKAYSSEYVQSNPELKASMENDTAEWERDLDMSKHAMKSKDNSKEQMKKNNEKALDAYKAPEAGDDTQSSKYS